MTLASECNNASDHWRQSGAAVSICEAKSREEATAEHTDSAIKQVVVMVFQQLTLNTMRVGELRQSQASSRSNVWTLIQ